MNWTRRKLLIGGTALPCLLPGLSFARLLPTPETTEGPFYPDRLPLDDDNDLVSVTGRSGRARGEIFHLGGRLTDLSGQPVAGAKIEIWQCDTNGVYLHSSDSGRRPFDPGFQGYGHAVSSIDGGYRFRTITPVPYTGRTPHIHFKVIAPGRETLTTQMYLAGHPGNRRDFLYSRLGSREARDRASVRQVRAEEIEPGAVKGTFDIVLG